MTMPIEDTGTADKPARVVAHDWVYRFMNGCLKTEAHNVRCRKCSMTARNVLEGNQHYPNCADDKPWRPSKRRKP